MDPPAPGCLPTLGAPPQSRPRCANRCPPAAPARATQPQVLSGTIVSETTTLAIQVYTTAPSGATLSYIVTQRKPGQSDQEIARGTTTVSISTFNLQACPTRGRSPRAQRLRTRLLPLCARV